MGEFSALTQKTILNRFIKCVLVKQIDWNTLFWLFEKNWFFTFLTQHCISKKQKFWKVRKNELLWLIWACHRHFSRYTVFKHQNWIKIIVFTIFFLGYFTTILLQIKMAKFRIKVLISEVANKTVLVFCMRPNKDTTYIPYLDHFSIL